MALGASILLIFVKDFQFDTAFGMVHIHGNGQKVLVGIAVMLGCTPETVPGTLHVTTLPL